MLNRLVRSLPSIMTSATNTKTSPPLLIENWIDGAERRTWF
jgi:hypothetical protein